MKYRTQAYRIKREVAADMLMRLVEDYTDEFPDDVNFFEKMVELNRENNINFNWIENESILGAYINGVGFSSQQFYFRLIDDMLSHYELHYVGDDDLPIIELIVSWALDRRDDDYRVNEMLKEIVECLERKSVMVDFEHGGVVKTMCEYIDSYEDLGVERRHQEQMAMNQWEFYESPFRGGMKNEIKGFLKYQFNDYDEFDDVITAEKDEMLTAWVVDLVANVKNASRTWVIARLDRGLSISEIMEKEYPRNRGWETWRIKKSDIGYSKFSRVSDILAKEGLTKFEVEDEIGRWVFSRKDVLKAIRRIVRRRRANGYGGG